MTDVETEPTTDEPEPENGDEAEAASATVSDGRCTAEVTMSGTDYRCALEDGHEDEHAFAPVDDTDTEPVSELAENEAEMLAANKKVAQSAKTYWESVRRNYGDDLGGFHECPLCVGYPPGLYFPSELPPEKAAALRTILGMPSIENYKRDNAYATCSTCDGLGTVLTGSKVPKEMTARCFDCAGKGFIAHDPERKAPERAPILDAPTNGGEVHTDEAPPYDPWGRPLGDPDYYRMPIPGATV